MTAESPTGMTEDKRPAADAEPGLLSEAKSRLMGAAAEARSTLRNEAAGRAETAKDGVADEGERLADSLYEIAAKRDGTLQGRVLDSIADSVSDMADSLRNRSFSSMVSEMNDFARRNPGAFVAVAALVGFAAVRFARSGATDIAEQAKAGLETGVPS